MLSLKEMPVMPLINSLAKNDPQELLMVESELTVQKSMNSTQIRKLEPVMGKSNIIKSILYLLTRCSENFNVGKNLTQEQALMLSLDLFEIFKYETLEDVVLMLKYARQGKIGDGKAYNLDGQTVMHKWVPQYLELKAIEREKQHNENKGVKNGMANFKWKKGDVDNLEVSKKIETVRQGFGERMKEVIDTPTDYKPPIQNRNVYLNLLKESTKKAKTKELQMSVERLKSNPKEQDALKIIIDELNKRKK